MRTSLALAAAALLMVHWPVHAQDSRGPAIYKVEFDIHDSGDPAGKARHYTMVTSANQKAVFKVGSRVPVATGSFQPGATTPMTQYTYVDVGVSIECTVGDRNGRLMINGNMDISTIAHEAAAPGANPTISQTKLQLETAADLGKPTVVAAIDDPVTMRQFQVQATVTRVN
jgi:Bacterial type II and III secretion system protein